MSAVRCGSEGRVSMRGAARQFAKVISCDHCATQGFPKLLRDETFNLPQPGYIGSNYRNTGLLLVGQNPGTSPVRFSVQDREFADAQIALRDDTNARSLASFKGILDRIMPTWVVRTYFPIAECGLSLDDIAYINVVRCRTEGNAAPGSNITRACIDNHLLRWLDWLQPRVVVCIGKWAHDNIAALLEERSIPNAFMNRRRSLSSGERRENKAEVVNLVRRVVSGKGTAVHPNRVLTEPDKAQSSPANTHGSQRESRRGSNTMDAEKYIELFRELRFHNKEKPNDSKVLRHKAKSIPSLYFNRNKERRVYFVGYVQDEHRFPHYLWTRICPQKDKDDKPNLMTLVPKAGRERQAFEELLA